MTFGFQMDREGIGWDNFGEDKVLKD